MLSGVLSSLVMVIVLNALVAPTADEKLVIDAGETSTGALPAPFNVRVCGLFGASSATESVAVRVPEAVGVKVTESVQLDAAGTGVGAVGHRLVTPKSPLFVPPMVTPLMCSAALCSFST